MQIKKKIIKWFMSIHMGIIHRSNGKIGTQLGIVSVLILHTTGRKSGKDRAIPIAYFEVGDRIAIVASNWGRQNYPDWYYNLMKCPQAFLEIRGKGVDMIAHEVHGDVYDTLWNIAVQGYPPYKTYREKTKRHIPIMVFTRKESAIPAKSTETNNRIRR